jgi:hypothetical protein
MLTRLDIRAGVGRGEALAAAREVDGEVLYLCGGRHCPHWLEQRTLFGAPATRLCQLTGHEERLCQPFYLEQAEVLSEIHVDLGVRFESALRREACLGDALRSDA